MSDRTDQLPRVLAVTNMYPSESAPSYGVFVKTQMESVASRGVDVETLFIDGRLGTGQYLTGISRVRAMASSGRFDLIHAHFGLTGWVASWTRLPLVVSFCGDDLNGTVRPNGGSSLKSRITVLVSQRAAHRAQGIICKSDGLRDRLWRASDRARAVVVPNGVDVGRFSPGDRASARAALGLGADERLVLFPHAREQPVKRFDLAEAAIAILRRGSKAVRLWVPDKVSHDRMPLHYQAADCLLLTSDREGSPNAVKEALCCDLPVVSVDAGDVARWLSQVPGCALVERTPDAIVAGLDQVLRGPRQVDGAPIRRQLSLAGIAEQVIAVYQQARARGSSR
jgi:glycosyltransferase involved in cell wall biosynthesis